MSIATTTELICFLVLSAVVVIGALGVVLLSNIVYSAFLLGGVFMAVAGLYLLLNAVLSPLPRVLVYVGAINVLDPVRDHAREQARGPQGHCRIERPACCLRRGLTWACWRCWCVLCHHPMGSAWPRFRR